VCLAYAWLETPHIQGTAEIVKHFKMLFLLIIHYFCRTLYNAIQNNKYISSKILINILYSLLLCGSFLLVCRFLTFLKIVRVDAAAAVDASLGENCAIFMYPLFTFRPVALLFSYAEVICTSFGAATVVRIPRARTVNHFFEIVLHNLMLYGPCIIFKCICSPTDTQYSYITEFIHKSVCSTVFRTSWVHLQERLSCMSGFGKR
jgi:hypothetical protein